MKILKDNYNVEETYTEGNVEQIAPYPRSLICEKCSSELEYEKSDMRMGAWGSMYLDCPLCGYDNMLYDNENNITLTVDNIEFPIHFHHTSIETGAVDNFTNEIIKKEIRNAVDYFRKNKDAYEWHTSYGSLFMWVHRYEGDGEYAITLSNNFYTMEIPFESEDY